MEDVLFVNGEKFLITASINLKFATVKNTSSRTADQISKILNKVIKLYVQGGFIICVILIEKNSKKWKKNWRT